MSSLTSVRSSLASLASQQKSRRDFLSWLGAGTAAAMAVGCTAASASGEDEYNSKSYTDEEPLTTDGDAGACRLTSRDARGPYFESGAPFRPLKLADDTEPGVRLFVAGRILGADCKTPLKDYVVDLWQADTEGRYYRAGTSNYRLRGKIKADAQGRYRFETVLPGRYSDAAGWRPAHIHANFYTPGGNLLLTTQLYFQGDPYLGAADYCTAAQVCNSSDPARILGLKDTTVNRVAGKSAWFDAILPRT